EVALPDVAVISRVVVAWVFITPEILLVMKPAAGGEFPLGFRGKLLAGPLRIRDGIIPRDLHDRIVVLSFDRAVGPFGMFPIGARNPRPPVREIIQRHRAGRGVEDE